MSYPIIYEKTIGSRPTAVPYPNDTVGQTNAMKQAEDIAKKELFDLLINEAFTGSNKFATDVTLTTEIVTDLNGNKTVKSIAQSKIFKRTDIVYPV
jgi:hypothetical protein